MSTTDRRHRPRATPDVAAPRLAAVTEAAAAVERARATLREVVRAADDDAVSIAELARAAGVQRQTVYAWLNQDTTGR